MVATTHEPSGSSREGREHELARGTVNAVARCGDWVLRRAGEHTEFVQDLLARLQDAGCAWAPRPGGRTADGRERLSFLPGLAEWELRSRGGDPYAERAAFAVMGWVRVLHDVTRDPRTDVVTCHGDLGPHNVIYSEAGDAAGLIDFDLAHRGARADDLATAVKELGRFGEPGPDADRVHDAVALLTAYGWDVIDVDALVEGLPGAYADDLEFCTAQAEVGNEFYLTWARSGGPEALRARARLAAGRLPALRTSALSLAPGTARPRAPATRRAPGR